MKRILSGIAVALLISGPAGAGELVTTAGAAKATAPEVEGATAPPLSSPVRELGGDDAVSMPPPDAGRCSGAVPAAAPDDRQPHGEVWAGVGTHGYRDVGTAMTAPVGRCGSVSIAIDRSEGSFGGWRR